MFIGDFMGHLDQINAAYDKVSGRYNYDLLSKNTPILSDADVTIGNLEVTLGCHALLWVSADLVRLQSYAQP